MHGERVRAFAPGRVNLIGDHTDYMGGLVMPMAVQMGTTLDVVRGGATIDLRSDSVEGRVRVELPVHDARSVEPPWGRYVAGVAAEMGASTGITGEVTSDLPVGAGLSSSAALEVAVALALGDAGDPLEVARRCQLAEQRATGVPCGIMDQLASAAGVEGAALLIDCDTLRIEPVQVPDTARIWVLHSGTSRELAGSQYAVRRSQCERAASLVGPLPSAPLVDIDAIEDPVVRARARHVRTECDRVRALAASFADGDLVGAGEVMVDGHRSLRDDFEVSTPELDTLVERLCATPGVHGARLTGAGFGGCAVALTDPGVELEGWLVRPSRGAHLLDG